MWARQVSTSRVFRMHRGMPRLGEFTIEVVAANVAGLMRGRDECTSNERAQTYSVTQIRDRCMWMEEQLSLHPGTEHGFGVRPSDEQAAKSGQEAHANTIGWMLKEITA
jgi:hypothetical protein